MTTADYSQFSALDIRTGTVIQASNFERAKTPAYRLKINFGSTIGILETSAQLTGRYNAKDLEGRRVVAVVNFSVKNIAGFHSQCLVLGAVDGHGDVSLLSPDEPVENGQTIA